MTDTTNHKTLVAYLAYNPRRRNAIANWAGVLSRIFYAFLGAMHESRRTQAEREIARFAAWRGGRITDDLEREMTRRLFTSDWSPRE
jgi:hypothetical protein